MVPCSPWVLLETLANLVKSEGKVNTNAETVIEKEEKVESVYPLVFLHTQEVT